MRSFIQQAGRARRAAVDSRLSTLDSRPFRAFTLMEIIIVVALMGMILAMGAPNLYRLFHKEGAEKFVSDLVEICSHARQRAILGDKITKVIFHPSGCGVEGAPSGPQGAGAPVLSTQFPDSVAIESIKVNLRECKDADEAEVRFFPNGTSDEMTLVFLSDKSTRTAISLEVTTGLAIVENLNP